MGTVRKVRRPDGDDDDLIRVFAESVRAPGACIQGADPLTRADLRLILQGEVLVYLNAAGDVAGMMTYRADPDQVAEPTADFMAVAPGREPNPKAAYALLCLRMCEDLARAGHDHVLATLDANNQSDSVRFLLSIGGMVKWQAAQDGRAGAARPVDFRFDFATVIPNLKAVADADR